MDEQEFRAWRQAVQQDMADLRAKMEELRTITTNMAETHAHEMADLRAHTGSIVAIQKTQAGMMTNPGLQLSALATKVDKLAQMQQHTDGRLNILISGSGDTNGACERAATRLPTI